MSQTVHPCPGQRYRHFKGNLYQIITIGIHSETEEEMVVYQALYGDFQVYIRPLYQFQSAVDKEKYPDVKQELRFQLVYPDEREELPAGVHPMLMQFLDAETYEDKLKIFLEMRDSIDEVILTDVATSLDISTGTGTLEEQYASVEFALHTLAKYERNNR